MDQNEKVSNDKITRLENEIKVLKNEVQAVLLDLRESYLNMENPFNAVAGPAAAIQPIVITDRSSSGQTKWDLADDEKLKSEPIKPEEKPRSEIPSRPASEPNPLWAEMKTVPDCVPVSNVPNSDATKLPPRKSDKLDIVTVAGLAGWVEESTKSLGKERTFAVLDMSLAMGCLTEEIKPMLNKLIELAPSSAIEGQSGTWNYLDSLIKINNLLSQDNRNETALQLLSRVSGDIKHG
jgi:hypothetical protein